MDTEMSPLMRGIAIAVLVLTPLILVVLQRLEAIREIQRKRKDGELDLSFQGLFAQDKKADPDPSAQTICPQCHQPNPVDHQFCGYCGAKLSGKGENEL
ncbi:MAG: hypothetical protein PWQ55_1034 [Chloroflexota bacterium]|nr:hypothetical protein [Chloroflexota bacterium]